mgnify:CR=1 FL=1
MKIHTLGYPRIGAKRELKKALEAFWKGKIKIEDLESESEHIQSEIWKRQSNLDFVTVGDFSLYDHVLDMSFTLGNIPKRVKNPKGTELDYYFRAARGRSAEDHACSCTNAGEMTKWFDTNYHYIVPEFTAETTFELNPDRLLAALESARESNYKTKPVIIGPITYLWLGKSKDGSDKYKHLEKLIIAYEKLLENLKHAGAKWVQIDEPALVMDLAPQLEAFYKIAYNKLSKIDVKLLLTTYFGPLKENLKLALKLPVAGYHIDMVRGKSDISEVLAKFPEDRVLSLGVLDGRNIWKTDLEALLDELKPIYKKLGSKLWLAPSCSLLHVPVDLELEEKLDSEIKSWLSFAQQKLEELKILSSALVNGRDSVKQALLKNAECLKSRHKSISVKNPIIRKRVSEVTPEWGNRKSSYPERNKVQRERLQLPLFPTTTIGSFPQTREIRQLRSQHKKGLINDKKYSDGIKEVIKDVIKIQEKLGLDVLVHGEAERNDMVEYFGEQLEGYAFSQFGWVQSYGSRCVKPPILFGDISRPKPMTIDWITFAQAQTKKPMKGMLTGPVTILNWSFV